MRPDFPGRIFFVNLSVSVHSGLNTMAYTFEEFKQSVLAQKPHYMVVGHPISHSLSPVMHQAALDFYKMKAGYIAIDLYPGQLPEFITWCSHDHFLGCNITIPYKQQLLAVPDDLHPDAEQIGAINTLAIDEFKLVGHNTDIYGFLQPLKRYTKRLEQGRAIVFGTGGASKAVVYALKKTGIGEIILVSRKPERARNSTPETVVGYSQWQEYADETALFVNATPIGMSETKGQLFINEEDIKRMEGKICYDLIYNPLQTQFLKLAKELGAITINGLEMLIHQGSKSFEIWTGKPFPIDQVTQKLTAHFESTI